TAFTEQLAVERGTAEHGEPQHGHGRGDQQHTGDELAHRAAARDPRDEHADEGRPRDPPTPVEGGPEALPGVAVLTLVRGGVEAHRHEVLQIRADRLHQVLEDEQRRTEGQHDQHHQAGEAHVDVGQPLDAPLHAGDHRDDGQQRDHADQHHVGEVARVGHDVEEVQPRTDLQHPQTERSRHAEQRADDRGDVDGVAEPAVYALADQRFQCVTDGYRTLLAVHDVGDGHTDDHVDGPRMQSPVQEGLHERVLRTAFVLGDPGRAVGDTGVVVQRLGHAPEDQTDTHTGREQHREPYLEAELGFLL